MKVSVIIPAYNEGGRIRETIDKLKKHLAQGAYDYEILIVDDKSSDNTG